MRLVCPECGSAALFKRTGIESSGLLLPGLSTLFSFAQLGAILCADCGLVRYYADQEACEKAREKWTPANPAGERG